MSGITFIIIGEKKALAFEERIQEYLYSRESKNSHRYDLLIDLNPYEDRIFTKDEVQNLIVICEELYRKYNDEFNWYHNRVRKFSIKLKDLCVFAISERKQLQAYGQ